MVFSVNDRFEKKFKMSRKIQQGFIELFEDNNLLHTNEDFAKGKGFSGCVMHGNILNGFLSYLIGECLPTKEVIIHSQEIQFKQPVYMDDELKLEATVRDIHESVNAVEFSFRFSNKDSKVVAKGNFQIGLLI